MKYFYYVAQGCSPFVTGSRTIKYSWARVIESVTGYFPIMDALNAILLEKKDKVKADTLQIIHNVEISRDDFLMLNYEEINGKDSGKNKKTVVVAVDKSVTEKDLMEQMGECSSTLLLPGARIKVPKERFKEIIERCKTLEEVRKYLINLEGRSYAFDSLGHEVKKALNMYGKTVPSPNFIFHGGFVDRELGKATFISNLSEETEVEMIAVFFRNCQMSSMFRDIIVKTYQLCKKAGIDKGDYTPKM